MIAKLPRKISIYASVAAGQLDRPRASRRVTSFKN
jgi:hypothetical protein